MKRTRASREWRGVIRTTAFRYSLLFTMAFSILTGASMTVIYQTAAQEIAQQIDARLMGEAGRLLRYFAYRRQMGMDAITPGVTERMSNEPSIAFCLSSENKLPPQYRPRGKDVLLYSSFSDLCDISSEHIGHGYDAVRIIIAAVAPEKVLIVGYDTHSQRRLLRNMLNIVFMVTGLMMVASFAGALIIGKTITNSIARISSTARRIVDGDFSNRIHTTRNDSDELNQLARNLNHMLDRIENLISSQKQVTNNIAHDLRSPLNRLRNRMEVALLDKNSSTETLRGVIADSVLDAENLLKTFNALLNIAQVEARARDDFTPVSLSYICRDLTELYEVMTEEGEHRFKSYIEDGAVTLGNRQLLAQAITNLLDNAIKYTPRGGEIALSLMHTAEAITIAVEDNGPGIPEDKRAEVLRRFVRLDNARSSPGNGLGLALVQAIVELHHGRIVLKDHNPGLSIEIILPVLGVKKP